ncbi:Zn-ribbon domain-containing OB-fold protein [Solibacillus sp. FSL K6-1523]|uniref:Zn-ribbon domain-containing OB-fold protein n=1 Tax=Solibacillus sp. FSL K6-1523 TaxID=2921471 RepID=UPI0030F73591
MALQVALKPNLFSTHGTKDLPNHPLLKGGKCECGHTFFPLQKYGCEVCGSHGDRINEIELMGRGVIKTFTTVYRNAQEKKSITYGASPTDFLHVPFVLASIILDEGCELMALIDGDGSNLHPGQTVYSTLVSVMENEDNQEILDLRFTPY